MSNSSQLKSQLYIFVKYVGLMYLAGPLGVAMVSLAKPRLKVAPAGRNCSLVACTNMCACAIRRRKKSNDRHV